MTKCPKCDKIMSQLNVDAITAHAGTNKFKSIIFSCPFCHVAIGAQIDPLLISDGLKKALKKG